MRAFQEAYKILDAKATTGSGTPMDVVDFRHLILAIDTASSGALTVKVQGSLSTLAPDFTASQTAANQWSYIQIKDLADASTVDGNTGVVASGTDIHRLFEVNTNALKWVNVIVTARSAGSVTAQMLPVNDCAST